VITYPFSRPHVNVAPPIAGPIALPTAEMETAKPLSVPKIRKLTAEFVRRITEQGKAKITAKHLTTMMLNITICCRDEDWINAVNGVTRQMRGNVIPQTLKQFRTPYRRATCGKIRNCTKQPQTPYRVKRVPIRPEPRPKPPENLKGSRVFSESGA